MDTGNFPLPQWCASWFFASPPVALAMLRISSPYSPISLSTRSEMTFILELSWCDSFRRSHNTIQHAGTWRLGMGSPKRWENKKKRTILDNEMTKWVAPLPPQIVSPKKILKQLEDVFRKSTSARKCEVLPAGWGHKPPQGFKAPKKKLLANRLPAKHHSENGFNTFTLTVWDSPRQPQTAPAHLKFKWPNKALKWVIMVLATEESLKNQHIPDLFGNCEPSNPWWLWWFWRLAIQKIIENPDSSFPFTSAPFIWLWLKVIEPPKLINQLKSWFSWIKYDQNCGSINQPFPSPDLWSHWCYQMSPAFAGGKVQIDHLAQGKKRKNLGAAIHMWILMQRCLAESIQKKLKHL